MKFEGNDSNPFAFPLWRIYCWGHWKEIHFNVLLPPLIDLIDQYKSIFKPHLIFKKTARISTDKSIGSSFQSTDSLSSFPSSLSRSFVLNGQPVFLSSSDLPPLSHMIPFPIPSLSHPCLTFFDRLLLNLLKPFPPLSSPLSLSLHLITLFTGHRTGLNSFPIAEIQAKSSSSSCLSSPFSFSRFLWAQHRSCERPTRC